MFCVISYNNQSVGQFLRITLALFLSAVALEPVEAQSEVVVQSCSIFVLPASQN